MLVLPAMTGWCLDSGQPLLAEVDCRMAGARDGIGKELSQGRYRERAEDRWSRRLTPCRDIVYRVDAIIGYRPIGLEAKEEHRMGTVKEARGSEARRQLEWAEARLVWSSL